MTAGFTLTRESPSLLRASGRIDVANAARALERCRASVESHGAAAVDLAALESADSVTLAVLLAWAARVSETGGRLGFVAMSPRLRALAHLSDIESLPGLHIDG